MINAARIFTGLLVLISAALANPADAAKVERRLTGRAVTISIVGEIVDGDSDAFNSAIETATSEGFSIAEVRLNSVGGSLFEGAHIARLVWAANMKTRVASGATCASACFLAFAAGSTKLVEAAARVGVHAASDEGGTETLASIGATAAMARIAGKFQVPSKIIENMVSTPASRMFWLSRSDLMSMGAITTE